MTPEKYYSLPTLRKVRRILRKLAYQTGKEMLGAATGHIILHDEQDSNIFKTRRFKARLKGAEGLNNKQ